MNIVDSSTSPPGVDGAPTDTIEFYFDPLCPWTWITSRFVIEVARHRPLQIDWKLVSLAMLNADGGDRRPGEPSYDAVIPIGTEIMRVLAAVAQKYSNAELGALYTAVGERLHPGGRSADLFGAERVEGAHRSILAEALRESGMPTTLIDVVTEEGLDDFARSSTEEAIERGGPDIGAPLITFDVDDPIASSYFGPVLNRIPRGAAAVAIFDAVADLARAGDVLEIKRGHRGTPAYD